MTLLAIKDIRAELLDACEKSNNEISNIIEYAKGVNLDELNHSQQFDAATVWLRMLDRVTVTYNILAGQVTKSKPTE